MCLFCFLCLIPKVDTLLWSYFVLVLLLIGWYHFCFLCLLSHSLVLCFFSLFWFHLCVWVCMCVCVCVPLFLFLFPLFCFYHLYGIHFLFLGFLAIFFFSFFVCFLFCLFLLIPFVAIANSLWDLCSPTRSQVWDSGVEGLSPGHWTTKELLISGSIPMKSSTEYKTRHHPTGYNI